MKSTRVGMRSTSRLSLVVMLGILAALPVFGQVKQAQVSRRPAADAPARTSSPNVDGVGPYNILNGLPLLIELHHDTEVGTNKPVDVYMFVIEMQIMNSDGDLEPIGLQIHNYFTKWPQDIRNDINRHNARDCKIWAGVQTRAMRNRNPKINTWQYVELVTNAEPRVLQTNEDGAVFYSDDIECWGSVDRFSPF